MGALWPRISVIPAAEKSFGVRLKAARTPETDTGSQVENNKAIRRITLKELGKITIPSV